MTAGEIKTALNLKCLTGEAGLSNEVSGGYTGDLLSWVMANAQEKNVWITVQGHMNSIAVASLSGISCIIMAENSLPEEDAIKKAAEEGIPVFSTEKPSYIIIKELISLDI
ncbi:MAG: DRTGG domain-containing protein [Lachnospiraceae bacterium]|nr:DRTGG domain-containing protein [Lachnospiraceae bacterium]